MILNDSSQLTVTLVPLDLMPFSGLHKHQTPMWGITYIEEHIHMCKMKINLFKKEAIEFINTSKGETRGTEGAHTEQQH